MQTKLERIHNAINGDKVDRYPFSFWTHLPDYDLNPALLAEKTYEFYKTYDIDLIKTMNNGMYACEDYGVTVDYSKIKEGGVATVLDTPVKCLDDFRNIKTLKIDETKAYKRELYSLQLLLDKVKNEDVPVIFTVFSPFTIANKLCGGKILDYVKDDEKGIIMEALQRITDTNIELVKTAIRLGASGVYMATQMSNYDVTDEEVFTKYGAFFDRQLLEASDGFADTIHCHGSRIMFDILKDYPVDIFNWHAFESEPSLEKARETDKCLMAGIIRNDITSDNFEAIRKQIDLCCQTYHGYRHIISPGCVIRYPVNHLTLMKTADYIKEIKL